MSRLTPRDHRASARRLRRRAWLLGLMILPAGTLAAQADSRPGPDSARVASLLRTLGSAEPVFCEFVSDQVGNFWWNDGSMPIGQLSDRRAAARLAKDSLNAPVRDARAIRLLVATLASDNPCVRLVAAKMLGESQASDQSIATLFDDASPRVREAALRAAAARERPAMRERIERMLAAREAPVVAMAAFALGEIEQRGSVPALKRVLTHDAAEVRMHAAWALGNIEDPSVAPDLERRIASDTDRRVRLAAIHALADLDVLQTAPDVLVRLAKGTDAGLREAALEVLIDIEDESLVPVLLPLVSDPSPEWRSRAIQALGELRATAAIPAITKALRDPNAEVRRSAVEALAEIEDP